MIDMKLTKLAGLAVPYTLPPKPDPIRRNTLTGEVLKDRPYIFANVVISCQAIEHDKQLDFAYEISRCIFGGTKDWHKEENLIEVTNKLEIDFQSIKNKVTEKEEEIISQIKKNQKEQLEAGHHGVPLSVYKDKFFFGQDKFNDLKIKELKKDGLNIK